ncbi:TadE family type IV pilus minor pilin [Brevibacterium rongguiense]|uniref:TadE family type IV pilus minor pilin n=1 Tax=Brevibacterium rongguiense TaxID=2695267 RepID=UPI002E2DA7B9|nr:TadE family type IV pilus minor pilin [Brevibacterium rongguiense]
MCALPAAEPGARGRTRLRCERGAATAEFAMMMPALVVLILVVVGAGAIGLTQLRAYDAARAGAREAARGEPARDVEQAAHKRAGSAARVEISTAGEYTAVSVEIGLPASLRFVMRTVSARAEARTEGAG